MWTGRHSVDKRAKWFPIKSIMHKVELLCARLRMNYRNLNSKSESSDKQNEKLSCATCCRRRHRIRTKWKLLLPSIKFNCLSLTPCPHSRLNRTVAVDTCSCETSLLEIMSKFSRALLLLCVCGACTIFNGVPVTCNELTFSLRSGRVGKSRTSSTS